MRQLQKRTIDYSSYYTNSGKAVNKSSFMNSGPMKHTIDLTTTSENLIFMSRSDITKYKSNRCEISKSNRSYSSEKDNGSTSLLTSSLLHPHKKHKSPIFDRSCIDETRSANSLLRNNQHVINKVYKSKHKLKSSKWGSSKHALGLSEDRPLKQMISRAKADNNKKLSDLNVSFTTEMGLNSVIYSSKCHD